MRESGYYPAGAEHDPNAPYNQVEAPERTFDIGIVQTFHIGAKVISTEYDGGFRDEEGYYEEAEYRGSAVNDFIEQYMPLGDAAKIAVKALDGLKEKSWQVRDAIETLRLYIDAENEIDED